MRIEEYCWAAEGEIGFRGGHLAGVSLSVALLVLLLGVKVSMVVPQTPKVQLCVWQVRFGVGACVDRVGRGEMREESGVFGNGKANFSTGISKAVSRIGRR